MFLLKKILFVLLFFNVYDKTDKIIIDNDAGADDAMAIFMTLLAEKYCKGSKLIGLTTGNGNTNEDNVCINDQRVLKVAKRQDVPIYRGSKKPLKTSLSIHDWYGEDGLGDDNDKDRLSGLVPAKNKKAVEILIEESKKYEGNLTVITIGALTNIALAIQRDPGFIKRLNQLYIGAGNIFEELPRPQFNAQLDVEAYHIVAQHADADKVIIFPYSVAKKALSFTKMWRETVFGAINSDEVEALNKYEKISLTKEEKWHAIDAVTIAVFLKPNIVSEYKYAKNNIVLRGDNRGITTFKWTDKKDEANVRVISKIKADEYTKFLLCLFKKGERGKGQL